MKEKFLEYLATLGDIHEPFICPGDKGGTEFYWDRGRDGLLDLGFDANGVCSYYAKLPGGKELVVDECVGIPLPDEVVAIIRR